ncbi:uncharacterized protein [Fopius arisanus]|uniref:Uncharacterized protein n=1 Tax=Fopius arisanus TaxID=64838 RepID=A0A9R1TQY0_9HYME|nr:PREDICTED: uncharacterized protein LOC105273397 [Fopius arisanus]
MNMNPQNPAKASRGSNIINSSNPRNAKADDVTIESYVIDTTGQPCCVDDDLNESRNSNVFITWRQIASVSGSFDDKHPEWIRSVQKLDQTYLIKESNDFLDSSKNLLPENTDYPPSTSLAAGKIIPVEKSGIIDANEKSEITLSLPKPVSLSRSLKIIPIPPININDVMMTTDSLDSASSNEISVKKRLRRKMNLLRESTDSLVSSFDTSIDNAHAGNSVDKFQVFPSIGGDQRHTIRQGRRKVSYWERAVRNTRNRFIPLAQRQVESTKNPLILPPVVPAHQR